MVHSTQILLPGFSKGIHLITKIVLNQIGKLPQSGILSLFLQHTSAGLIINENADPDVQTDLEYYFNKTVPANDPKYTHTLEGEDDMPAHIKSAITGVNLNIPIIEGKLALGTWQGIYLWEFRKSNTKRQIIASIIE